MFRTLCRWIWLLPLGQALAFEEPLFDPTRPPEQMKAQEEVAADDLLPLNVSLIVVGPHGRHAVVNGSEVKIGDTVAGNVVLAIHPRHLQVRRNGMERTVAFLPSLKINQKSNPPK